MHHASFAANERLDFFGLFARLSDLAFLAFEDVGLLDASSLVVRHAGRDREHAARVRTLGERGLASALLELLALKIGGSFNATGLFFKSGI